MPHTRPALLSLALSISMVSCTRPLYLSRPDSSSSVGGAGGQTTLTDGPLATGGVATDTGGMQGTGGLGIGASMGNGGTSGFGGAVGSGGAPRTGGVPASGGLAGTGGKIGSGGATAAGGDNACQVGKRMISDFESPAGQASLNPQQDRTGYWYVFFPGSEDQGAPATGRKQTPSLNNGKPIATEPLPDAVACSQFALHSTALGFDNRSESPVGFGAFFKPHEPDYRIADAYDVSPYTGISFRMRSGSGTAPAVFFEVMTRQTMPTSAGGSATADSFELYSVRGQLLLSPWSASDISGTYQTFTVPFGTLVPRWLPTTKGPERSPMMCPSWTDSTSPKCQAKSFDSRDVLGIRVSANLDGTFPQPVGSTPGTYDLWIDDVTFIQDDTGLQTRSGFPLDKPGSFGTCRKPLVPSADAKFLVPAYNQWKATFVRGGKVIRPDNQNDTLSEGIAFGMLIALNMNDQPLFDGLYGTWKGNPASTAGTLMKSCLGGAGGSGTSCTASDSSATGADQDAAYALLMADKLWGGTYKADAIAMIKEIWDKDIDGAGSKLPKGGSGFGAPSGTKPFETTSPSYFAPYVYRAFASVDPDASHDWAGVIAAVYAVISGPLAGSGGLLPAWCGDNCTVAASNGFANDVSFQYDSHRVPMRIGLDYCFHGTAEAKTYSTLATRFFVAHASQGFGRMEDMYTTSGGAVSRTAGNSASLIGSAAVGAMAADSSQFVDEAYQTVFDIATRATLATPNYSGDSRYAPEPTYSYYNATVGLLTLLILTGNFLH